MTPEEVIAKFPVRRVLELSPAVRNHCAMLLDLGNHLHDCPEAQIQAMKANAPWEDRTKDEKKAIISKAVDAVFQENPGRAFISMALTGGAYNPIFQQFLAQNRTMIWTLIWGLVFGDLVRYHNIDKKTWEVLRVSLIEEPPACGVIITGYSFSGEDLGTKTAGVQTGFPDFIPNDILALNDEDPDDD